MFSPIQHLVSATPTPAVLVAAPLGIATTATAFSHPRQPVPSLPHVPSSSLCCSWTHYWSHALQPRSSPPFLPYCPKWHQLDQWFSTFLASRPPLPPIFFLNLDLPQWFSTGVLWNSENMHTHTHSFLGVEVKYATLFIPEKKVCPRYQSSEKHWTNKILLYLIGEAQTARKHRTGRWMVWPHSYWKHLWQHNHNWPQVESQ